MATDVQNTVLALVVGMFDAAPGATYLNQFTAVLDNGAGRSALAESLVQTSAFQGIYSSDLSNQQFAAAFITTLVGENASDASKDWAISWMAGKLDAHETRAEVMLQTIDALQGISFEHPSWGQAAQLFANKISAAAEYSVIQRSSADSMETLRSPFSEVTADPAVISGEVIFSQDFDHRDLGDYSLTEYQEDMGRGPGGNDNQLHTIEQVDNDNMLKVTLQQGVLKEGLQSYISLGQDYEALSFRFDIRFGEGFDWAHGGKMPGLSGVGGDNNATGQREPLAVEDGYDGFSLRSMYREDGRSVQYRYDLEQSEQDDAYQLGDNSYSFETGVTYTLEQWVILNTAGEQNGTVLTWIDGQLVAARNDYLLRSSDEYGINKVLIDIWAGGSTDAFRPSQDSYVFIDDLIVTTLADYEGGHSSFTSEIQLTSQATPLDSASEIQAADQGGDISIEESVEITGVGQVGTLDLF
ncbi:MAG: hypothetical protein KC477_13745 [Oceanospirillaceae bacterium]|nr:hypothetical protein [Oceanospirillaceae bacterium]